MIPVVLEEPTMTRDGVYNEEVPAWVVRAETYATKRALSSRESFISSMHSSVVDCEWSFRWRAKLDPRWRIREVRTGELHEIIGVLDPSGKRRVLVVRSRTYRPDEATELSH